VVRSGDERVIAPVLRHNARDVVSLVRIMDRVARAVVDARAGRAPWLAAPLVAPATAPAAGRSDGTRPRLAAEAQRNRARAAGKFSSSITARSCAASPCCSAIICSACTAAS